MLGWPLFRVDLATTQLVSTHLACDVSGKAIDISFAVFSYQSKGSLLRGCWKRPIFGVPIVSVSVKSQSTFDSQLRVNAFLSKRKKLAPLVHYLFLDNFFYFLKSNSFVQFFWTPACATVSDREQTKICWVVIFNQTLLHSFLHLWLLWIHTSERTHMRGGCLSFIMCLNLQLLKIIWVKIWSNDAGASSALYYVWTPSTTWPLNFMYVY